MDIAFGVFSREADSETEALKNETVSVFEIAALKTEDNISCIAFSTYETSFAIFRNIDRFLKCFDAVDNNQTTSLAAAPLLIISGGGQGVPPPEGWLHRYSYETHCSVLCHCAENET